MWLQKRREERGMGGGERTEGGGGERGLRPSSPTPSLNRVLPTLYTKQVHFSNCHSFSVEVKRSHQRFGYRCTSSLTTHTSLCSGWRGATDLHDSTTSPVCNLVKKERKESEEDEDGILCKLQRDDVSTSCSLLYFTKWVKPIRNIILVTANSETPTLNWPMV